MTTHKDMSAPPQKPKRRWGMILLSVLLAFLLIGIIIAIVASIDPESSPASVAPADGGAGQAYAGAHRDDARPDRRHAAAVRGKAGAATVG